MFYSYNGITFELLKTNLFALDAVYTDDDADYLYTHVQIDIDAYLNPSTMSYLNTGAGAILSVGSLPATTIAAIRRQLLQERGQLTITDYNSQTVLSCPAPGFSVDVRNGPHPISCQIRQVTGARTWLMRWVCECWIKECPGASPAMISNRYQEHHLINANHLTTRIISGKMVFRSDFMLAADLVAHQFFNGSTIPPVAPGFQRESVDVMVETSGLALQWTIRDQAKMYDKGETDARLGGSGILHIEGTYGIQSLNTHEGPAAGNSIAQIDIRAHGNRNSNQWTMIQTCFQIVITKMQLVADAPIGFVQHAAIRESMGENEKWVEVSISYLMPPITVGKSSLPRIDTLRSDVQDIFDNQDGTNPGLPWGKGARGTEVVTIVTQALQQACQQVPQPVTGNVPVSSPGTNYSGPPPSIRVQPVEKIPNREKLYRGDFQNQEAPYTSYRSSIEYDVQGGTLSIPSTGPPPSGAGGGSPGEGNRSSGPGSPSWSWPAQILQISSPLTKVRVSFQAERAGAPPKVPTLVPNDQNMVLSFYRLRPDSPIVWNDGETVIFAINGYYEFLMKQAPQADASFSMGVLPWTNIAFTDSRLQPSDFVSGIYDNPSGSGGGGPIGPTV